MMVGCGVSYKNTKYTKHEEPTEFLQLKYYKGLLYGIKDHL
jgi:hypothetical protein